MQQDQQNLHQAIARLWEKHRARVSVSIDGPEGATVGLLSGTLERERQRGAEDDAHKLASSLGTFGYPDASREARDIELLFGSELGEHDALELCELARRVAAAPPPPPLPAAPPSPPLPAARSEAREVVQALELGAFDHVAKPFSLPILMQRVRRALA